MQSWTQALRKEGIEVGVEGTIHRSRAIVETFREIVGSDHVRLHRLCDWLAPSLYYTVGSDTDQGTIISSGIEPLDREYVSFSTAAAETDKAVAQIGEYTVTTKSGVVRIGAVTGRHIGTAKTWEFPCQFV